MSKKHTHIRVSAETRDLLRRIRAEANIGSVVTGIGSGPSMSEIVHAALLEYQSAVSARWRKILGDELYAQTLALQLAAESIRTQDTDTD